MALGNYAGAGADSSQELDISDHAGEIDICLNERSRALLAWGHGLQNRKKEPTPALKDLIGSDRDIGAA